jgi:glycerate kinase
MKVLIAPDKFKGSLTAREVCEAIRRGLLHRKDFEVQTLPLADGGDGTLDVLLHYLRGSDVIVSVRNPVGRIIESRLGLSGDGRTALIEMADASGMKVVDAAERDIMHSGSFGTGQLIAKALDLGAGEILLGIGGSATNDAGLGASEALGFRFYDETNRLIQPVSGNLTQINRVDDSQVHHRLKEVSIQALCDVTFPFAGPTGAAHTFAPQKGAAPEQVRQLDAGLQHIRKLFIRQFGVDVQSIPGTGAGGGLPASAVVLWNTRLRQGIDVVSSLTDLAQKVKWADAVITGEGCLDEQSLNGKVFDGVSRLCREFGKTLIVMAGDSLLDSTALRNAGVDRALTLVSIAGTRQAAVEHAGRLLPILGQRAADYLTAGDR